MGRRSEATGRSRRADESLVESGEWGIQKFGLGNQYRRKGYGAEALTLLLRFYFGELRYAKCDTSIYSFNEASIRLHERLGFQTEGRIRRAVFTNGEFHDELLVGMTSEEFFALHDR